MVYRGAGCGPIDWKLSTDALRCNRNRSVADWHMVSSPCSRAGAIEKYIGKPLSALCATALGTVIDSILTHKCSAFDIVDSFIITLKC